MPIEDRGRADYPITASGRVCLKLVLLTLLSPCQKVNYISGRNDIASVLRVGIDPPMRRTLIGR